MKKEIMANKVLLVGIAFIALAVAAIGVSAVPADFVLTAQSGPEKAMGMCIVEVDQVIDADVNMVVVITEIGRKPAWAKVQALWFAVGNEDGFVFGDSTKDKVFWTGELIVPDRTLTGDFTGVSTIKLVFPNAIGRSASSPLFQTVPNSIEFVQAVVNANGILIPSAAKAGELQMGITALNGENSDPYHFRIIAAIESPVGNHCRLNVFPVV